MKALASLSAWAQLTDRKQVISMVSDLVVYQRVRIRNFRSNCAAASDSSSVWKRGKAAISWTLLLALSLVMSACDAGPMHASVLPHLAKPGVRLLTVAQAIERLEGNPSSTGGMLTFDENLGKIQTTFLLWNVGRHFYQIPLNGSHQNHFSAVTTSAQCEIMGNVNLVEDSLVCQNESTVDSVSLQASGIAPAILLRDSQSAEWVSPIWNSQGTMLAIIHQRDRSVFEIDLFTNNMVSHKLVLTWVLLFHDAAQTRYNNSELYPSALRTWSIDGSQLFWSNGQVVNDKIPSLLLYKLNLKALLAGTHPTPNGVTQISVPADQVHFLGMLPETTSAVTANGDLIAYVDSTGEGLMLWNIQTGRRHLLFHETAGSICRLTWETDETKLIFLLCSVGAGNPDVTNVPPPDLYEYLLPIDASQS